MIRNLHELVDCYSSLRDSNNALVLATLIDTEGSTYRKPGARMLFDSSLKAYGHLAMGIDDVLAEHARETLVNQTHKLVTIDLRSKSDEQWEHGQNSNGMLIIFFEYLLVEHIDNSLEKLSKILDYNEPLAFSTITESDIEDIPVGTSVSYTDDVADDDTPHIIEEIITPEANDVLLSGISRHQSFLTAEGSFSAFIDVIRPKFRLLVLGAGADVTAITRLTSYMGWDITLSSPDVNCTIDNFPDASRCLLSSPDRLFNELGDITFDAVVLMTHNFEHDLKYLKLIAETSIPYIGVLGPEAKRNKLLDILDDKKTSLENRLYGPTGLEIGAELPEEVALSIIAEIQATRKGKSGAFSSLQMQDLKNNVGTHEHLHAIVLGAGASSRFGGLKQTVELDGKSLLRRSIETAQHVFNDRVLVVLGNRANKIQREVDNMGVLSIINSNWENGLSSSIRAGVGALPQTCEGVMILFCDQILIETHHLMDLIETWNQDHSKIIACGYSDTVGVPVIIPAKYFSDIADLRGDYGAKSIIEKNIDDVVILDVPEAGCDIDTQEDMLKLLSH